MNIMNLTPHEIQIMDRENKVLLTLKPSGKIARVSVTRQQIDTINGIPINRSVFGAVENLPDPHPDTVYVVSAICAQAAKERTDLLITDDAVRDKQGRIIGCHALARM